MDYQAELTKIGQAARAAARHLALLTSAQKNACLLAIAQALEAQAAAIIAANAQDLAAGEAAGLSRPMLDRLQLDSKRLAGIVQAVREVAALPDPVGTVDRDFTRPNGLHITRVRVPLGVIGIIYESRPNVTVDAGVLCLKTGNAVILRGGKEAIHSNLALAAAMADGCRAAGVPGAAVTVLPWIAREAATAMVRLNQYINLIIPRGGTALISFIDEHATVPVIKHDKGLCSVYVDRAADLAMALDIIDNAKCHRPATCNAAETLLIHRDIAAAFAPQVAARLTAHGVEVRGDAAFCALVPGTKPATAQDWDTEYLELILAVRVVDSLEAAMAHIAQHGSAHSDTIVTQDAAAAERFLREVDSAAVYHNASTRFTDGGEFGMGAEIGISTNRLHARGPMGLEELTTYKYVVHGTGQVRK